MGAGLKAGETLGGRGVEEALCRELGRDEAETKTGGICPEQVEPGLCPLPPPLPLPLPPPADGGGLPQLIMPTEWVVCPARRGPPDGMRERGDGAESCKLEVLVAVTAGR